VPDFNRWTSNGGDPSLNDINRVDRLFDALGSKQTAYSTDHAEAELAFLLADWRDEVRDAPVTAPVTTTNAAAAALRDGLTSRKRNRTSLALVGSVAAAVLCIGGFGAAVFTAEPGGPLYGMRTTLFGQEQVRNEQVALASQQLQQVQQLIDEGQWDQAQNKLAELSTKVQGVEAPPEQKQDLIQQWNALTYKVVEQDPAATLPPPGEPLPVLPESPLTLLPLPVIDVETSTSTSASGSTSSESSSPSPGPEIVPSTPPSDALETPAPTSAPSSDGPTPSSTPSTSTSPPTSPPTTTTTTIGTPTANATSVTPVPPAPQPAAAPSPSAKVPARASEAPPAPPSGGPASSRAVAPSQSDSTVVTTTASKRSGDDAPKPPKEEPEVVTTTIVPPR
jgi:hypothetical protein